MKLEKRRYNVVGGAKEVLSWVKKKFVVEIYISEWMVHTLHRLGFPIRKPKGYLRGRSRGSKRVCKEI